MSKITESSLFQLTLVRFREFLREPEAIFWVFLFPILLAGGLGLAFKNRPPEVLKVGAATEQLVSALSADKGLSPTLLDEASGTQALRNGRIVLYVSGAGTASSMKFDDTNPEARTARLLADRALQRAAGAKDAVQVKDEMVREPGSRYIDFVVPGLLGMNLMGSGIWGLGFTIVDARRRKLLKRLVASPMPRWQYLMSFLVSRLVMLVFEVAALVGSAALVFGVPLRGGIGQLAILCLLSALSFSCLGLLIASQARTIEAASGLMNLVMLPMWVLSGVFFSPDKFPAAFQPFIRLLPLTAVIDALRSNMLQGQPLTAMTWQLAVISGWLVIGFLLALRLFKWR